MSLRKANVMFPSSLKNRPKRPHEGAGRTALADEQEYGVELVEITVLRRDLPPENTHRCFSR